MSAPTLRDSQCSEFRVSRPFYNPALVSNSAQDKLLQYKMKKSWKEQMPLSFLRMLPHVRKDQWKLFKNKCNALDISAEIFLICYLYCYFKDLVQFISASSLKHNAKQQVMRNLFM
jgi:hypothetical protein